MKEKRKYRQDDYLDLIDYAIDNLTVARGYAYENRQATVERILARAQKRIREALTEYRRPRSRGIQSYAKPEDASRGDHE